ncbi:hypothetical protein [Aneurinibacillus uraniidurans]|uniref:hypothetical protein n=1 Tax=Aneurinibacillus uraniidurans TaxID=2966586 RepID=UPI00234A37F9|nr:hypothetical protein [Aneurinibacillus sp. B1]WCN39625.1 hypothetical protein PO771_09570 [Aneurinibacillus sp. B1]
MLKTEVQMWYYALFAWRERKETRGENQTFSFHKNSVYWGLFLMFLHEQILEGAGLHFVLHRTSPFWAWIVTALHVYTVIWLIGDYKAIRHSRFCLIDEKLELRVGFRKSVTVELSNIAYIGSVKTSLEQMSIETDAFHAEACPRLAPDMGLADEPQFEIELHEPVLSGGLFGRKQLIRKLYIRVDEPSVFLQSIKKHMCYTSYRKYT